jgi:SAM-dependent methyltransferase
VNCGEATLCAPLLIRLPASDTEVMSLFAEHALYTLARLLYRTDVVHDAEMKQALQSRTANNTYRSQQLSRVLAAAKRFQLPLDGDILDLGCNDGALTVQYDAPGTMTGVDIDAQAIERAKARNSRVTFLVGTPGTLPLPDASMDGIVSYDVFEHVANPGDILAECRRVLRPGGWMLIGTWGWGHPFAPHLWATMPVPWAHLLVSERTLFRACRRVYHASWYRPTFHDLDANGNRQKDRYTQTRIDPNYLNKFKIRDFEKVFRDSDFAWEVSVEPFGSAPWVAPLLKTPLREYLHAYLWAVLRSGRTTAAERAS